MANDTALRIRIHNSRAAMFEVRLEPLGEAYELAPGKALVVTVKGTGFSDSDDPMEIYSEEGSLTIYGWGQSLVTAM
jgi:hypothetical protein